MNRSLDEARTPGRDNEKDPGGRDAHASRVARPYEVAELREKIDSILFQKPTMFQFLDRLEEAGIRPVPSIQKSGRFNGMSYEWDGARYRGSELGRAYTARGLEKNGVLVEDDRDAARLRQAERRARENPARSFERPSLRDRSELARHFDALSASERSAMREIGRFRAVMANDFLAIQYQGDRNRFESDLTKLTAKGLVESRSVVIATHDRNHKAHTKTLFVVVLTKQGLNLFRRFDPETRRLHQCLYAGFVKPREMAHDTAIYRMYQAEAAHIHKEGGRIKRVILDFELKKQAYRQLAKARAISVAEFTRKQQEVARDYGLKVVGGKLRLPDLRIEYERENGDAARVDLELATEHYRADHMSAKQGAGFKIYAEGNSLRPGGSGGRGAVRDDHEIEIYSF